MSVADLIAIPLDGGSRRATTARPRLVSAPAEWAPPPGQQPGWQQPAEVEDLLACMAAKKKVAEEEEAAAEKAAVETKAEADAKVAAEKAAVEAQRGERHFDEYMQWLSEMVGTFKSNGGLMHRYEQVLPGAPFDLSKVPHGRKGDVRQYLTSLRRILSDLRRYVITSPEEQQLVAWGYAPI